MPRIERPEGEILLERKAAAVLACLALRGACRRAELAAWLWPDATADGARNNLRQALFKLKKAAGCELVAGGDVLSLAAGVRCDCGEDADDARVLLSACDFDDCPELARWLESERRRLSTARIAALVARAEAFEREGDLAAALRIAERIAEAAPLEETHHRRVMRLHYLAGDRAAALAAYERCALRLREELDAEPGVETRTLAATIGEDKVAARPAAALVPLTLVRPPRLVGRDRELAAMAKAWSEGRAFVVLGDAGLGKTRLLAELAAQRPAAVMSSARPGDATVPYASLARLLREIIARFPALPPAGARPNLARLMPELRHEGDEATEPGRAALQRSVAALMAAAAQDSAEGFILDDLHFADAASLEMLQAVACDDAVAAHWGFAQRPAEGAGEALRLRESLTDVWRLEPIALVPLDAAQMREFLESLAIPGVGGEALAAQLVRITGGNPQFTLETLKSAVAAGVPLDEAAAGDLPRPPNVQALIERRLKQLSPQALALARLAAIASTDFNAELACRVMEAGPLSLADAWRELEDAQVLKGAAFAHDLIYEATRRGVPAPLASHAHRLIAEHLQGHGGEPARVAEHWIAAAEPLKAVPFLKAAAARAEAAARFEEARRSLETAVRIADVAGDAPQSMELRFLLIELLKEVGNRADVARIIAQMNEQARTPDERLRVARAEAQALGSVGEFERSKAVALALLEDEDLCAQAHAHRVNELRYALADTYLVQRDPVPALAILEPMEEAFRSHPDLQFRGWFYSDLARALYSCDRMVDAGRALATALDLARQVGRRRMTSGVLLFASNLASAEGRIGEPVERAREAQLLIAEMDDSNVARVLQHTLGELLLYQGRYGEALAAQEAALASKAPIAAASMARGHSVRGSMFAQLGLPHRARASLAESNAARVPPSARLVELVHHLEALHLMGDPIDAALDEYERLSTAQALESVRWRGAIFRALALNASGADLARFEAIANAASQAGLMGHALGAQVAAARCARSGGDGDAVRRHGQLALELLRRFTLPGAYRPALWLACHDALDGIDPSLAARALREGHDWVKAVARFHLPAEMRASFLSGNPVNRVLLRKAGA